MTSNVVDRQKRFVDADFFENGGKKASVFKNIRIRVDGALYVDRKIENGTL